MSFPGANFLNPADGSTTGPANVPTANRDNPSESTQITTADTVTTASASRVPEAMSDAIAEAGMPSPLLVRPEPLVAVAASETQARWN